MKKVLLSFLLVLCLSSCAKQIDDSDVKKMVKESRELETIQTTKRPIATIKAHEDVEESKIVIPVEESTKEETTETENVEEVIASLSEVAVIEEQANERKVVLDDNFVKLTTYDNKSFEKTLSKTAPVEQNAIVLSSWRYGMTPLEWIFIEPNNQLISNNKPNSSITFAYKLGASSGSKGCFIPIFAKCDCLGSDYDGRVYCTEDYTKSMPEEMLWGNKFTDLVYEGHRVIDILADKYVINENGGNIAKVGDTYVNVVYVSELDEILGK